MPRLERQLRSEGSTWREISTISAVPVSSTTAAPIFIATPRAIGPRFLYWPLEIVLTVPVTVRGGLSAGIAGIATLPPIDNVASADPGGDRLLHYLGIV